MKDGKLVTVGVPRGDGSGEKDYRIHYDGETFFLTKTGGKFECRGVTATIKEIKNMILEGAFKDAVEDTTAAVTETEKTRKTWDCIDPCALLVLLVEFSNMLPCGKEEYFRTLDNYGWLAENGRPDLQRANRLVRRFKHRETEQQTEFETFAIVCRMCGLTFCDDQPANHCHDCRRRIKGLSETPCHK